MPRVLVRAERHRLALLWPGVTLATLVLLFGAYAIVDGVFAIGSAISSGRDEAGDRWWLGAQGGAVSILFGIFLLVSPGEGALAVAWLIGLFAIMFGVSLIALGLRLRGHVEGASPRLA